MVNRGCLGITNALVCLSSDRSLHNADINGKSIFLLFSRSVLISIVLVDVVIAVDVVDGGDIFCIFWFVVDTGVFTMFWERKYAWVSWAIVAAVFCCCDKVVCLVGVTEIERNFFFRN